MKAYSILCLLSLTACSDLGFGTGSSHSSASPSSDAPASGDQTPDASSSDSPAAKPTGEGDAGTSSGADTSSAADGSKIVRSWECDFQVARFSPNTPAATTCSDTIVAVNGYYSADEKEDGDMFVRTGIDHLVGTQPWSGTSKSEEWAAGTYEATNGASWLLSDICSGQPTTDIAATGNWGFVLDKSANVMTASYLDTDVAGGKVVLVVNCQLTTY